MSGQMPARLPRYLSPATASGLLLCALALVVYVLLRTLVQRRRSGAQRHIVLAGPPGAGKTHLFTRLVFGSDVQCCTSSQDNEGLVVARWDQQVAGKSDGDAWPPRDVALARPLLLLDTPGLPALRARVLARSIPQASGVVFVLDPVGGLTSSRIRETADALHLVLALVERSRTPIPLLVLLTRADAIAAASRPASIHRARAALEREMERRRAALASGGARGPTRLDGLGAQAGAAMLEAEDEAEIVANGRILEDATAPWSFADACPQASFALVGKGEPLDGFWAWADARR